MWPQSHGQWDGNQSDNVYSGKMTTILHGHSNFRAATQRALDNFLWLSKCDPTFFFFLSERQTQSLFVVLVDSHLGLTEIRQTSFD